MRATRPTVKGQTEEKIVKLVNEDPTISLKALAKKIGIQNASNIHYHIRKLEAAGRIHWQGVMYSRGKKLPSTLRKRWEKGLVKLPRLTQAEQDARIEMVARKAEGAGKTGELDPGDDVVRFAKGFLFKNWRLRGCRF